MVAPFGEPTTNVVNAPNLDDDTQGSGELGLGEFAIAQDGGSDPAENAVSVPNIPTEITPPGSPQSPTVFVAEGDGVRILQPQDAAPDVQADIRLDAITYNPVGDVALAGRGVAGNDVRILLDDETIQVGQTSPSGDWAFDLPEIDPGTYVLRVEQIGQDGTVSSGIETPFLREDPDRFVNDNPMRAQPGASVITVQPNFTLWGIAQANLGDGHLYVQIFQENRDAINDPDLIFPGQIFALPDAPHDDNSR